MPAFGMRAWYNDLSKAPEAKAPQAKQLRASWVDILEAWSSIELDLQDWGIDCESGILRDRTWRWLSLRIVGLISTPSSRLHRRLSAIS